MNDSITIPVELVHEVSYVDMLLKYKDGAEAGMYRVTGRRIPGEIAWYGFTAIPFVVNESGNSVPPTTRTGKSLDLLGLMAVHPAHFNAQRVRQKTPIQLYTSDAHEKVMSEREAQSFLRSEILRCKVAQAEVWIAEAINRAVNAPKIIDLHRTVISIRQRYGVDRAKEPYINVYNQHQESGVRP